MAIVDGDFYSPRPSFGVKFSEQVDDLRYNSENTYPIVVSSEQDYDATSGNRTLVGFRFGKIGLYNKYEVIYDDSSDSFKIKKNTNTESSPIWSDLLEITNDDKFTVKASGGFYSDSGIYGVSHPANPTVTDSQNTLTFTDVNKLVLDSTSFYLKTANDGSPVFYSQSSTLGKSQIFSFAAASTSWTINHNFGITPLIVQVYDENYNMIIPDNIDVSDSSTATVTFYQAQAGYAMVSSGALGVRTVELAIPDAPPYTPTNVTTNRSFDANTVTLSDLADVVGTMIQDLQNKGILE